MDRPLSIMLVDDNGIDLFLHEKLISLQPFTKSVTKFTNAADSIAYLQNAELDQWPDIILLDIQMPIQDGFEFLIAYQTLPIQSRERCGIIMVSSSLNLEDIKRAKANPEVLDLLTKPLSMQALKSIVDIKFKS